jgi:hypothetical protein
MTWFYVVNVLVVIATALLVMARRWVDPVMEDGGWRAGLIVMVMCTAVSMTPTSLVILAS